MFLAQLLVFSIDNCASFMINTKITTSGKSLIRRSVTQQRLRFFNQYIHHQQQQQQQQQKRTINKSFRYCWKFNSSLRMSSSSSSSSSGIVADDAKNSVCTSQFAGGSGTYIGLSSTFDACHDIGQHIPIDERYIPSSLLEWGYVPTTLETIVFETLRSDSIDQQTENMSLRNEVTSSSYTTTTAICSDLTRSVYTILPATGCDNDNLETIATTEQYKHGHTFTTVTTSSTVYKKNGSHNTNIIGIETCFRWIPEDDPTVSVVGNSSASDELYRIRINVEIQHEQKMLHGSDEPNDDGLVASESNRLWKIINPIRVAIEKQLDESCPMNPDSIKSGGLDSRTITQLLGPILHSENIRSFPKQQQKQTPQWETILSDHRPNGGEMIAIPGNLTITTFQGDQNNRDDVYQIDIGYIQQQNLDDTNASQSSKFIVVSHHIPTNYMQNDDLSLTQVSLSTKTFDL